MKKGRLLLLSLFCTLLPFVFLVSVLFADRNTRAIGYGDLTGPVKIISREQNAFTIKISMQRYRVDYAGLSDAFEQLKHHGEVIPAPVRLIQLSVDSIKPNEYKQNINKLYTLIKQFIQKLL